MICRLLIVAGLLLLSGCTPEQAAAVGKGIGGLIAIGLLSLLFFAFNRKPGTAAQKAGMAAISARVAPLAPRGALAVSDADAARLAGRVKFLFKTSIGTVATLDDGSAVACVGDMIYRFSTVEEYRISSDDDSGWKELTSAEDKRRFCRDAAAAMQATPTL